MARGGRLLALSDALLQSQVALATTSLAARDYQGAIANAETVLASAPDHAEALRVHAGARAALDQAETALSEAQALLDAGQREQAAQAVAAALAIDPSHALGVQLAGQLNSQFRSETEGARVDMNQSRAAAQAAGADTEDEFTQGERLSREAQAQLEQEQFMLATQRFLEAREVFGRARRAAERPDAPAGSAAVGTTAEARPPAVGQRGAAPDVPPERAATAPAVGAEPVVPEQAVADPGLAPQAAAALAALEPRVDDPAICEPVPPTPAPSAPAPVDEASAIRNVIATYEQAIEGKDLELYRSVKPNLSAEEASQLQASFAFVESQQIDIENHLDGHTGKAGLPSHRAPGYDRRGRPRTNQPERAAHYPEQDRRRLGHRGESLGMPRALVAASLWLFCSAATFAQEPFNLAVQVDDLSSIFTRLYGPNGLIVDSLTVLPGGDTHSGHFNADFQSEFVQFGTALTSKLVSVPLPSLASGFTYEFDPSLGVFNRTTPELWSDPGRAGRNHWRQPDIVWLCFSAFELRYHREAGSRPDPRRVYA